jgi:hypothetical protein
VRLLLVTLAVLFAVAAHARVATISFAALVKYSKVVVLARVTRVESISGMKVATAEVLRGTTDSKTIAFIAEPTWTCDVSTAFVGETVLLFLAKPLIRGHIKKKAIDDVPGVLVISHAGRGRIRLTKRGDTLNVMLSRTKPGDPWHMNVNVLAPKLKPFGVSDVGGFLNVDDILKLVSRRP